MAATPLATELEIRNILVATDFSRSSRRALTQALNIAHRYASKLYLFHAVPSNSGTAGDDREDAWREAQSWNTHLRVRGDLKDIEEEIIIREGDIWDELSAVVRDRSIDLIVLGTHGRTGLEKLVLDSVAETIFRKANCLVLTVGPKARRPHPVEGHRQILVPIDFSAHSEAVLPYAQALANQNHASLALLHVLALPVEESGLHDEQVRWAQFHLRDVARREGLLTYGTELLVRRGATVETMLKVAKETHTELIVMGIRAPSGLADHRMWPNAYMIVCGSTCPVLTVRSPNTIN